ncbi:CvpA family protein [Pseudomonas sp. LJDD11]|uniref:CvpA family protein n=1 Tax=unclassified Pseudomonas TaxID=196821 RepID=UPI0004F80D77|nr:CvpA family protein [Pseudomonas sp. StFLB209]MCO8163623.1 CvpA family protein [Pseudomonas sp. 21LCFQ010]MCQ9427342.1 CvpA family protein [Pseudomonas sp. LJDD11]BAP46276.1 cvpA family protein [Pseudomonas sp. StFLB209]
MALTPVDWAILVIIAISALISIKRGFVKEALSLLIWIIAGAVAWMFGAGLSHYLADYIATPSMRVIASCIILFVATLIVGAMVNFLIGELIRVTGLSGTDRFLGMVFGAARGALLIVVAVGLLSLGPVQQDQWWQESRLVPQFLMVADWSKNLIVGMSGQWSTSGIGIPAELPFKEQILSPEMAQDVLGKSSSTK